jgi:fido (protein-threonine AMPylation protein)
MKSVPGMDPYVDPVTGVLRNRLGIARQAELNQVEAALTASRLIDLERQRLHGNYDLDHLRAFHRYILGDVYDWRASYGPYQSLRDLCSASRSSCVPMRQKSLAA